MPEDILPLAELKLHCRIDYDDEDTVLAMYRLAAIEKVQGLSGKMLDRVSVEFYADYWDDLRLPWSPIASISSVEYKSSVSAYSTLSSSNYWYNAHGNTSRIHFKNLPTLYTDASDRIKITASVGYDASAGEVPTVLKQAVALLAQDWYEFRGDEIAGVVVRNVPNGIRALISEQRSL